jgi:PAS domain S-box-containing protein
VIAAKPDPVAERDLRAEAFDASPLALVVLDGDGVIAIANSAAGRFLGRPVTQIAGARLVTLVHPDQVDQVAAMIDVARAGRLPERSEIWFVGADKGLRLGGFSVARLASSDRRVVVVIRDVTHERQLLDEASERARVRLEHEEAQRREAEGTAERAEMGLRLLIDTIPDLAILHEHGRIVHANHTAVVALGHMQASELIGRLVIDITHPDDWVVVTERMRAVTRSGGIAPPRVIHLQRRDGSYLDAEFVAVQISFRGRPVILGLGRDLSERKKLEAQLAMSERLVAMGRLVAGIGHEVNNPLAYVMANLEMIEEDLAGRLPGSDVHELVRDCREGVDRIRKIIAGLRSLSRGGHQRDTVDLKRVLELAVAMTHNEIRHRARLVYDLDDMPVVIGDDTRLSQVFVNLLVNAAQAIPDGQAAAHEIGLATGTDERGRAFIEIRDTGCGIPSEDLSRIFDPFFTTKTIGVGTGLGLSISHSIVTEYGGTIEVDSEVGRGTRFRVILPPARAEPVTAGGAEPAPISRARRGRILVIDDEAAIGIMVQRALRSDHEVVVVHSGREALAHLDGGATFDVILCDLMMPDMTGMEVYAELEARLPHLATRVVFITGGAFTPHAVELVERTSRIVLEKPFAAARLRQIVREAIDSAQSSYTEG